MPKMLKTHQNTIGNLMIALLFVGGCVFLLTGSWDASETEAATGCCGGGDATLVAETIGGCCGGASRHLYSTSTCSCSDMSSCGESCGSDDQKCQSVKADKCGEGCNGKMCGEGSYCNSESESSYCNRDSDFSEYYCSATANGCSEEYSDDDD